MSMIDADILQLLYVEHSLSIRAAAAALGVAPRTVYGAMIQHGIARRRAGRPCVSGIAPRPLDAAAVRRLYQDERRSLRAIAAALGVSLRAVRAALAGADPPRPAPPPSAVCAETLRRLYLDEGRTIAEIAAATGASPSAVRAQLVRAAIPLRPRGPRPTESGAR